MQLFRLSGQVLSELLSSEQQPAQHELAGYCLQSLQPRQSRLFLGDVFHFDWQLEHELYQVLLADEQHFELLVGGQHRVVRYCVQLPNGCLRDYFVSSLLAQV